jgi:hypothetical protein
MLDPCGSQADKLKRNDETFDKEESSESDQNEYLGKIGHQNLLILIPGILLTKCEVDSNQEEMNA